ncbi:MAG TPA: helix-turn-helix domain-containing protein [Patescibacteria group bacterium]|nr:helix-turn-helix domain-containing protein [Patescibacteria group bacterium]
MEHTHLESLYPEKTREEEIGKILSYIKSGKSSQLIALPGVGRANLLGFLAYNRQIRIHHLGEKEQMSFHFVLCNFSEMKNRPLFDVMKFLFLELSSSLHERKRDEEFAIVDKLFKDALSYQDELVLFQELKNAIDYLTLERNLTVTFLLERFETYTPQATEAFFNNLRSIRNRAKYKFSVVFSTTRPLEDVLEPELLADFYEYVADNHVYLSLFDKVGLAFRVSYLEKLTHEKITQTTVDKLISLTGGHGKLMRLALESAFSHNKIIDTSSLLGLKTIHGALLEIWYFLTPDEQQDILAICKNTSQITNDFLQNIGLIKSSSITIPLFKDFCLAQREKGKQPAVFTLDLITNTIQRGDTVISDMLTRSEFRLFKLLLESQGAILSREDIIQAVWTDSKTQEGVSEQALDQLVFRLRKKVEEDPNNPMLIQTVKGRGFRFVQPLS